MTPKQIRDYIRHHIKATYGTQIEAGKRIGVSQSFLSKVLTGQKPPPAWLLEAVRLPEDSPLLASVRLVPASACRCQPGNCRAKAARECRDWIKRAATSK